MKAHIIFDDSDEIGAMHVIRDGSEESGQQPRFRFAERPGIHVATVEVPAEFANLSPSELHVSVRVEGGHQAPRLVADVK
jgi:hypothetical protein